MIRKLSIKKILFSLLGILSVCIGVAFNNNTLLGNDPIGMFYDGLRIFFNFERSQLGLVSNFINFFLLIILFIFGKKYFNIGTFLYLIPYGLFVSIGSYLYSSFFDYPNLIFRIFMGIIGCSLYYIGIGIFISCNIGTDPFNGLTFTLRDKLGWSLRKTKIALDVCLTIVGFLLGGTLGIITVFTAFTTGPAIQYLSPKFSKIFHESQQDAKSDRKNISFEDN
ncbi:hypothetical protein P7D98_00795 [Enterococcus avium]|uniref:YczE/YyaS/YitT family protein n=1 Tax=Enterococcus avium TaxID=33945 RepID=UPI002890998A|nr:hypothetical protein [Enterococcus avium]MDT2464409.1 hypothetical protein [Enterococcus avium]MDT2503607.1 hypothetical protein [Enterococcus avium]